MAILAVTVLAFLFLTCFILDTILLCQRFIASFYDKLPRWDPDSLNHFMQKWLKDSELPQWSGSQAEEALSDWMLIQLVARRTNVVGKLIFFPFIIWFLMFIARLHYFDNWRTPPWGWPSSSP